MTRDKKDIGDKRRAAQGAIVSVEAEEAEHSGSFVEDALSDQNALEAHVNSAIATIQKEIEQGAVVIEPTQLLGQKAFNRQEGQSLESLLGGDGSEE